MKYGTNNRRNEGKIIRILWVCTPNNIRSITPSGIYSGHYAETISHEIEVADDRTNSG